MKKKIIIGNWKMNKTNSESEKFLNDLKKSINNYSNDIVVCVPFVDLVTAKDLLKDSKIKIGAQNMYFEDKGAYTGEISPKMLVDLNVEYVILGHSERRKYFKETDNDINKKLLKAYKDSINPILCVGESLNQYENNETFSFIENQLKKDLLNVKDKDILNTLIAYEPIWAIGTGKNADKKIAEKVCKFIREFIENKYNKEVSSKVNILYGGSVNSKNSNELLDMENIDGLLIGGSSLTLDFVNIINMI